MSRKKKVPSRFESGERESCHYHESPEDKYKQVYNETFDRLLFESGRDLSRKTTRCMPKCKKSFFLLFTNKNVQKMTSVVSILSMVTIFVKRD